MLTMNAQQLRDMFLFVARRQTKYRAARRRA